MALRVTFNGGAGSVTGSEFLVTTENTRVLVDCGIEQGKKFCDTDAAEPFAADPKTLNALIVTHAHLDHIGRIPKLIRDGFTGTIYSTAPTRDLAALILADSVTILAEEAAACGTDPIYHREDVERAFSKWQTVPYHQETPLGDLSFVIRQTGHILGAGSVRIKSSDGSIAFTGDIGHPPSPLIPDWEPITDADALVMDAVYGDRVHEHRADRVAVLQEKLKEAIARGGAILIPAFSLERTQLMLYHLSNFFDEGVLPKIPVFLDSPLAIHVTDLYRKYGNEYFRPEAKDEIRRERDIFSFPFLTMTGSREESEAIAKQQNPKIIIAGAGMSHGGRIGRWETRYLPDPTTTLFIVGYQAPGSPGRLLQENVKKVRINRQEVKIQATIENITGWSGHADRDELVRFAQASLPRTKVIFPSLGEPATARFLAQRIHDYVGVEAVVPSKGESWEIANGKVYKMK